MKRRKIAAGMLTAVMMLGSIGVSALGEENVDGKAVNQVEMNAEAPTEAPAETSTEAPTEALTEKPIEVSTDKPTEATAEIPTEEPTEAPTEKPTEAPTEVPTEAPIEKPTEAPTEVPADTQTEAPTEAPTEKQTEASTETPEETSTEKQTETSTEMPEETAEPETEVLYTKGYARTRSNVSVYNSKEPSQETLQGQFAENSVVYALERFGEGRDENEWLRIVYAVKEETEVSVKEGYIQAKFVIPAEEVELPKLTESLALAETKTVYQNGQEQIVLAAVAFTPAEQPESETVTEAQTEEPETETAAEPEAGTVCSISADWDGESLGIGDMITLTALCDAEDTVEWQSRDENGIWTKVAEGQVYSYELTMDNYSLTYRAVSAGQAE